MVESADIGEHESELDEQHSDDKQERPGRDGTNSSATKPCACFGDTGSAVLDGMTSTSVIVMVWSFFGATVTDRRSEPPGRKSLLVDGRTKHGWTGLPMIFKTSTSRVRHPARCATFHGRGGRSWLRYARDGRSLEDGLVEVALYRWLK